MKKLDKLLIKSFIGPLILTFCVSVFILLIQYMLKYFDDLVGKDLGYTVFAELLLYFSINMTPIALPLAILIASIMTYGNLGEHFELTAIKGSGISLTRTLLPTGILVVFISIGAFFSNNYIVPNANLRAYSLLYDIKHKKPALDLREGQFYEGIPDYSIKVREKHKDGIAMSDIIIYDHEGSTPGNKKVIIADSCRMYTIVNDRYLMMELFNGHHYIEGENKKKRSHTPVETFARTKFAKMNIVFSLSSFDLDRTDMELFSGNRLMKDMDKLDHDIDSMSTSLLHTKYLVFKGTSAGFKYHLTSDLRIPEYIQEAHANHLVKENIRDSIRNAKAARQEKERTEKALKRQLEQEDSLTLQSGDSLIRIDERASEDKNKLLANKKRIISRNAINEQLKRKSTLIDSIKKASPKKTKDKRKDILYDDFVSKQTDKPKIITTKLLPKDTTYITNDSVLVALRYTLDSLKNNTSTWINIVTRSVGSARTIKTNLNSKLLRLKDLKRIRNQHKLEKNKKISQAVACFIMFLIGAPLGAIIKKGGMGMPVIVSVFFFIIFYVLTVIAEKWAKAVTMDGYYAAWVADIVLLPFGIQFLYQARKDAKLFDSDFYTVWFQNLEKWFKERKQRKLQTA